MSETRVPTSEPKQGGWSLETAIDYLLAVVNDKHATIQMLIAANDKRYEERFAASQKALELGLSGQRTEISVALAAQDRAVQKAEAATEKRFESVNEFRGTLDQQQRTLIPRSEVAVLVDGLNEKISNNTKQIDEIKARERERSSEQAGIKGGWGYAVGVASLVLLLLGIVAAAAAFVARQP